MARGTRDDVKSIRLAKEILDRFFPELPSAITSETEDFGWDVKQGDNFWEIKTNNRDFGNWVQWVGTDNVKTTIAPPIEMSPDNIQEAQDRGNFPSEWELDCAECGKRYATKCFPLNVTGRDMKVAGNKWWKIVNEPKSNLMVQFKDCAVLMEHDTLMKSAMFYGWIYTDETKHFGGRKCWQLKVFIDLTKGKAIKY